VKNRNRFYSYRFHVYVTFLPYTWKCIRENFHLKYMWFSTLRTLTTYVTWRWKSGVTRLQLHRAVWLLWCLSPMQIRLL